MTEADQTLQQVIFPVVHDPDVLPLYIDADYWTSFPLYESSSDRESQRGFVRDQSDRTIVRLSDFGVLSAIRGRHGFRVPHRRRVSFGTYFNAFPAAYWRRWTELESVRLRVETSGTGQVLVVRSNARGVTQRVDSVAVSGSRVTEFDLDITRFGDGGWYWFDLVAEEDDFELMRAGWYSTAAESATTPGTVSLSITTLNRVPWVIDLLETISRASDVIELIDRIHVVDQGTERVRDHPAFGALQGALGDRLHVVEQRNLGGSGGFSRGMLETLEEARSRYVLLLDDDIAIEPESIRRLLRFADHTVTPTIVGGHMFDMYDRSKLHAFAEGFDMSNFMWGPLTPTRHDFASANLRQTSWLHRRIDAQYNGWWMCLIPTSVIREVGLSLPVFIKWDDSEYALRAAEHGVATVSLPGAAVWHVSWVDKDDSIDWQAFFHARNRIVAALLHSSRGRGGRLARANLAIDLKHLFSMQYFAATARIEAYRNVLEGPEQLHADMLDRLSKTRELMADFSDSVVVRSPRGLPSPSGDSAIEEGRWAQVYPPRGLATLRWLVRETLRHLFVSPERGSVGRPQAELPFSDARWWVVGRFDSVVVSTADGTGRVWYRRDPARFRALARQSARLRRRIRREWPQLSRRYREALPDIVSERTWRRTFGPEEG